MYGQALKPVRTFADGCMQKHSFWRYIPPTKIGRDIKEVKEEIEAEIPSEFQSEILKPCAIGEDTSLTLFCKTNTDLPEKMYTGIVTNIVLTGH